MKCCFYGDYLSLYGVQKTNFFKKIRHFEFRHLEKIRKRGRGFERNDRMTNVLNYIINIQNIQKGVVQLPQIKCPTINCPTVNCPNKTLAPQSSALNLRLTHYRLKTVYVGLSYLSTHSLPVKNRLRGTF